MRRRWMVGRLAGGARGLLALVRLGKGEIDKILSREGKHPAVARFSPRSLPTFSRSSLPPALLRTRPDERPKKWTSLRPCGRSSGAATPSSTRTRCATRHGDRQRASRSSIRPGAPPTAAPRGGERSHPATVLTLFFVRALRSVQPPLSRRAGPQGAARAGASDQGVQASRLAGALVPECISRQHGPGAVAQ